MNVKYIVWQKQICRDKFVLETTSVVSKLIWYSWSVLKVTGKKACI